MDWETLQGTWTALPEATRTRIVAELSAHARVKFHELDRFYPSRFDDTPEILVLGIVDGVLHFLAHDSNYVHAQSGSDFGSHFVFIGEVEIEGDTIGSIVLTKEIDSHIGERGWESYRPHREVETVRDKVLAMLGVTPPKPEMATIVVQRCPSCGATNVDRNLCNVCNHSDDGDWTASHEQRADDDKPEFVAPAPSTEAGFELRGTHGDPGRVLVHHGTGYAIVLPSAWPQGQAGAQSAIATIEVWVRVVSRAARVDGDLRRELLSAARRRADVVGDLHEAPVPKGGTWCGYAMYDRTVDYQPWAEMLALSTKGSSAMFLYVGYPTRHVDLFQWLNLRAALLALQTWQPDELDGLHAIWPSGGAFSEPKMSLGYVRSGDQSGAKAEELGEMSDEPAMAVNGLLLREAGSFVAPAAPWTPEDTERVAFAMRACAGRFAPVILSDLDQAKTMHDFRKWCTLVKWAVDNKGRRRK